MDSQVILESAQHLANRLQSCSEIERFREAERQVKRSRRVKELINTIKKKQKELVHAKHYQKVEYIRLLEKELDDLQYQLDHLPIVREYQQSQVEVNDLIQTIQSVLVETVSHRLEVETGEDIPSGCGNGGPCGCGHS